jgi:hypothetical protein
MFTAEQRDHVRQRVLEVAQSDPRVIAGALTGSMAFGGGDRWSDINVAFGIAEGITLEAVLDDWTHLFEQEWGVLHHFDLPFGSSVYRVFLLPSGLEIDVAATPAEDFGPRGPNFRALFGPTQSVPATPQPSASSLIGLSWLYVRMHTRASSATSSGKPNTGSAGFVSTSSNWRACAWERTPANGAASIASPRCNGSDRRDPGALPRRARAAWALAAVTRGLIGELQRWDSDLCARLSPLLHKFSAP